jgi:hypothetical protein
MSQWAHSPWNKESPEVAPASPAPMAAQPAKQEEAEGVLCGLEKWLAGEQ